MFSVQNVIAKDVFQHTAARRRLEPFNIFIDESKDVSTHSRPKAAGYKEWCRQNGERVSTHSRPKAAGNTTNSTSKSWSVSTHSRPKAAGSISTDGVLSDRVFQHTAARRRLDEYLSKMSGNAWFQHTAARRRLAGRTVCLKTFMSRFNTQPPEGGWRDVPSA